MKFVNLDESEIIEQPLEKVIARPDYSPIEFGYDNLCSLDSVSVDGIHPSGGDSDLILPPSVNKINSCFKSEYFKISNLFSEIQTYEQKQQALKNLGILDTINNSTYIHDLGTDLQPHIATGNIITYVKDNNIKETVLFKYIDTDGSSTLGVCISRINDIGWIIYLVARKGIERLVFNSNGVREECNEYGGVLRHNLDSVADEQLECLSVKGVKSLLSTKLDALSPGDGITMMNNTVSTLIGNGLTYNGREIVIDHDLTLKTNNGKLGVNAGDGLYVNPDNELGINIGKGLAINHTDSTVEVAEEVFEELDSKAPLEGYAPNLKVRFSDGLVGRIETIPREIGRISPTAGISVDDNSATIERIKGESVVWNQLLSENKFRVSMATLEDDGNYYKVIPTDASANRFQQRRNVIKDHVYLQTAIVYNTSNVYIKFCNYLGLTMISSSSQTNASEPTLIWEIKKATETIESYIQIGNLFTLDPYWVKKNSFFLYDLTLMFGAGNEPTTIEEFEARKPLGVTNDYNEGTIVSFQGGDVKSVGFNAWDEEVHLGHYVDKTGLHANVKDRLCSKNPIKIIPNSTYYKNIKEFGVFYDSNMNYIGNHNSVNIFTTPPNAAYYQFNIPKEYGTTYKNDICIHLVHSGYRNGEYEPYVEDIHPLPDIKSIKDSNGDTLFPYGLLSAGNVHDEITATKAVKRIGVVDMGSLTWNNTEIGEFVLKFANIFTAVKRDRFAVLTNKYVTVDKNYTALLNGEIMSYIAPTDTIVYSRIGIRDDFYTDNATFKQAMQGVLLYYELAEPIEVDLEEPLNMTYEAWDFGTEELVVSEPSTSLKGEIIYHFNAVDRIRENSRAIETLKEHVEERKDDGIELLTNGNLKLTLKGETREFMPATPSGDPMHYAYVSAGAEYNGTNDFIVKNAPWKDMVDTIEDKAKWGFDIVDASQVKQMTIRGTVYNYVQTTRQSPGGITEPRYFLVGQASDGTWVEDETKVLHLPGHWYLNGLGDITGKEILPTYRHYNIVKELATFRLFQITKLRTFFPLKSSWYSQYNSSPVRGFYYATTIEAVNILSDIPLYNTSYPIDRAPLINDKYGFNNAHALRYIPQHRVNITNEQTYKSSTKLHVVPVVASEVSLRFNDLIQISKNSILYIINNAAPTTPITITLHADRYAQLSEDTDIVATLDAKNAALAGTGGSISLVSA